MKKAIVSGASGFIGLELCKELLNKGYHVIAIHRGTKPLFDSSVENYREICCDMKDIDGVNFEDTEDALFFHFSWQGVVGDDLSDFDVQMENITNTRKAMLKASEAKCRKFIFAGSIFEYENQQIKSIFYNKYSQNKVYGYAKAFAHNLSLTLSKSLNLEFNSCLISNVYGPNEQNFRFISTLVNCIYNKIPLKLSSCEQNYDFIYITDAVEAIIIIGEKGLDGEEYYVGSNIIKKLKEYVKDTQDVVNPMYLLDFDENKNGEQTLFDYNVFSTDKIEKSLLFQTRVNFKEGIQKILNSIKEEKNRWAK